MPKQTGPKSDLGKKSSSSNRLGHGCRSAQHWILPGESEDEFAAVRQRWVDEYGVLKGVDAALLERLAQAEWRMLRCDRQLATTEAHLCAKPLHEWSEDEHKLLLRARRYYSEALRFYQTARRDLDWMRMQRQREFVAVCRSADVLEKAGAFGPDEPETKPGEAGQSEPPPPTHPWRPLRNLSSPDVSSSDATEERRPEKPGVS